MTLRLVRSYREKFYAPDPEERYAMRFALALLMPAEEFLRSMETGLSTIGLALKFDVPAEAVPLRQVMLTEGTREYVGRHRCDHRRAS